MECLFDCVVYQKFWIRSGILGGVGFADVVEVEDSRLVFA
jgi:hypothetical protein